MRRRDVVGGVGESRGALVGGDHEIGIVTVLTHHFGRRNNANRSDADIVGHIEKRRDKEPVTPGAFGLYSLARGNARQTLRYEAALGADWNDHRVLHILRFDEAEDLGAEILRP